MAWIELDPDKLILTPDERETIADTAAAASVDDPTAGIVASLTNAIRGRCRAAGIALETGATIPEEIEDAALAILRFRLLTYFPEVAARLLDEHRKQEYTDAMKTLTALAKGEIGVESAADPVTETATGGGQKVSLQTRQRRMDRTSSEGL